MTTPIDFTNVLSKLSHDLKNNFIVIRAATASIKKHAKPSSILDKKITLINEALDRSIASINETYLSSLNLSDVTNNVMKEKS